MARRKVKSNAEALTRWIAATDARQTTGEEQRQNVKEHLLVEQTRLRLKYRILAARETVATLPGVMQRLLATPDLQPVDVGSIPPSAPKALKKGTRA